MTDSKSNGETRKQKERQRTCKSWWIDPHGGVEARETIGYPKHKEVLAWVSRGAPDNGVKVQVEYVHVFPFKRHAYMFVDECGGIRGKSDEIMVNVLGTLMYQQACLWRGDEEAALEIPGKTPIFGHVVVVFGMAAGEGLT